MAQATSKIEPTDREMTSDERRMIGRAHFDTSVFNVSGRTEQVQQAYREHFADAFAEIARPFGGR